MTFRLIKHRLATACLIVLGLIALTLFSSCASSEKNLNTAEGLFAQAKEYEDSGRYEIAITKYNDVRNKFPYNPLAIEAELAIADAQYNRENYADSQIAYQNFRDLHPSHTKTDYVIYKTAMSYYLQLPDTIDRDLTLGNDAIYHFDEVIKLFPKSQYATEAKQKRQEVYNMLAEKELYIADFYFKQQKYTAALRRYEQCLVRFPSLGYDPRATMGAIRSALAAGENEKAKKLVRDLTTKYPQSEEAKDAKSKGLEGLKQ